MAEVVLEPEAVAVAVGEPVELPELEPVAVALDVADKV